MHRLIISKEIFLRLSSMKNVSLGYAVGGGGGGVVSEKNNLSVLDIFLTQSEIVQSVYVVLV